MRTTYLILSVLIVLAALGGTCVADIVTATGTVESFDSARRTISVRRKTAKGDKAGNFTLSDDARIVIDGGDTDLSALKAGDNVTLTYDTAAKRITRIERASEKDGQKKAQAVKAAPPKIGEMQVHVGLPYAGPKSDRQKLDIYCPEFPGDWPILLWIHGGGFEAWDKKDVDAKPKAFVEHGIIFISTNYRFDSQANIREIVGDIAKSIRWVHDHAREYGGDPDKIFVMGHEVGAFLSALVCTDDRYLKAEGLSLSAVKGCIPVEGDTFDVRMEIAGLKGEIKAMYTRKYGPESQQRDLSPINHVEKGKAIPPFLFFFVANHHEMQPQAMRFAKKLKEADIPAELYPANDKDHLTLNSDMGQPGDQATQAVFDFLERLLANDGHDEKQTSAKAGEMHAFHDIAYAEPKNQRQMIDVYAPANSKECPIVFWIHGGGMEGGDKSEMSLKPKAFVDRGFVFVATNYRFLPHVTIRDIARDIAKSIRWVHDHARDYGGDPDKIFVMGHSAGALLSALVCTDERYLKAEGLSISIIKGCVPVDGDTYDVRMQIAAVEPKIKAIYRRKFGPDGQQRDLSPVTHVVKSKRIPPFLLLYVADHPETGPQALRLARKMNDLGKPASVFAAQGKNHLSINWDLGKPGDGPTQAVFDFLDRSLKSETASRNN